MLKKTRSVRTWVLPMSLMINCAHAIVLNNPYSANNSRASIYYASFTEQPKTLDPARAYSSNEYQFIAQIYEPFLQYDYYERPYKLIPLTTHTMPAIRYLNSRHEVIRGEDIQHIAYSVYTLSIKPGILFQQHPALAKNNQGEYRYLHLPESFLEDNNITALADFAYTGTRELVIDDYIYQIKRLANPAVHSPIYGLMSEKILGFREFGAGLSPRVEGQYVDLRKYSMSGLKKVDKYTFEITLKGQYPQFLFWLAMPFFSPIPWEAEAFYVQKDMSEKNISFDWYPVGTGPFYLSENNPNKSMVLKKNTNFRLEYFPVDPSRASLQNEPLKLQRIPMIEAAVFTLEKESIPRWNKFLQGYYDLSGIGSDSFDQAIRIDALGHLQLSPSMQKKKLQLTKTSDSSIYYLGFNMLDSVVGGGSNRARLLRQAISIAVNYQENISLFLNGRGQLAQGPIPPGIFGFVAGENGINPYVYQWADNKIVRRDLDDARRLMTAAGYSNGRDPQTGKNLVLHYDITTSGGPDDKAQLEWMRKQFAHIGIDLDIRATQYNRFQEKMRNGNAQIFSWSWAADYPDPENFLFMLYSKNAKVTFGGENAANYSNARFDTLFEAMKSLPNGPRRQEIIDKMVAIVRHDAPWVWGINTENITLAQPWLRVTKPSGFNMNQLRYLSIDVAQRNQLRRAWNQAKIWPLGVGFLLMVLSCVPLIRAYRKNNKSKALRLKP